MTTTDPVIPLAGKLVDLFYPWRTRINIVDDVLHMKIDGAVRVSMSDGFAHVYTAGLGRIIKLTGDEAKDAEAIKAAVVELRGER